MPNYSLKPGRGPSAASAVGGVIGIGFGVLWTIFAFVITADAPFPAVHIIFPLFGLLFICAGIFSVVSSTYNATQPNRFSIVDLVESNTEPDPLTPRPTTPAPTTNPSDHVAGYCDHCGASLRPGAKYCSRCGKAVA